MSESVTTVPNHRGSALLIVLGFLSFMVVSAVAFAVYMRAERVPSSALRRNVATRHLVKAAMARAISCVDDAVRNDLFPGRPGSGNGGTFYRDASGNPMDVWLGRVFMPPDPEGSTVFGQDYTRYAPITKTVSVLNLEGLGYLPPPVVNDVRFLSRCSWTSKWQNFPFDSGRYAYVAVNVSDFFDINVLLANTTRNSSDNGRITLASVFKDQNGKNLDTQAAQQFDNFVHENREAGEAGTTVPYVSMLDYNLALGSKFNRAGLGGHYCSPFWNWLNNAPETVFYQTLVTNSLASGGSMNQADYARSQSFITDSWFPSEVASEGSAAESTNLLYEAGQPFLKSTMDRGADNSALDIAGKTETQQRTFWQIMRDRRQLLSRPDSLTMFDYLDRDDCPLSLCIPSCERIPMLTAFTPQLTGNLKFKVEKIESQEPPSPAVGETFYKITNFKVTIDGDSFPATMPMQATFAFPFKRSSDINDSYKATALMRLVLVAHDAAENVEVGRRVAADGIFGWLRPKVDEWNSGGTEMCKPKRGGEVFVINYRGEKQLNLPTDPDDEDQAFADGGRTTIPMQVQGMSETEFFTYATRQQFEKGSPGAGDTSVGSPQISWTFGPARPARIDGSLLQNVNWCDAGADPLKQFRLLPYLATWVKVENSVGCVDYVPAIADDDAEMGLPTAGSAYMAQLKFYGVNTGDEMGSPFLRAVPRDFLNNGANSFQNFVTLAAAAAAGGGKVVLDTTLSMNNWSPKSYFTVDPRFNWAPEHWLHMDNKNATGQEWLDYVHDMILDKNDGHEVDIFMGYSNQGYLQSMGEIAMLPRLTDVNGAPYDAGFSAADWKPADGDAEAWKRTAHAQSAWFNYAIDYQTADEEEKLIGPRDASIPRIVSDGSGFRVNPFSDNPEVMKAVVEMTPYDWWAAGTNTLTVGQGNSKSASVKEQMNNNAREAAKHAFGEDCQSAKLDSRDAAQIANYIMSEIQSHGTQPWEVSYDQLPWGYNGQDPNQFMGISLRNNLKLHSVDRKYLYAFWRGCLANKQQLFLIFVRAESNALGGPGEGTPSQKGGRAVALVWRDPTLGANEQDNHDNNDRYVSQRHPHRTRILFYHQFE